MILSGQKIKESIGTDIVIEPFTISHLNPNSYNLTLGNDLLIYEDELLDMKQKPSTHSIKIPEEGYILKPGKLYLGQTAEFTHTDKYVPMLEGRSSIGRLGLSIHVTAGFGDIGFSGYWTLELFCLQPIRIYAGVPICQIYYHTIADNYSLYNAGKYSNNLGVQASKLYEDFQ